MSMTDILVIGGSIVFLALFYWWFFWAKEEKRATASASATGVQETTVTVKGGYSPDHITVRAGQPVRINFRREESGECTDRVVMPAFRISQPLPAFATTPVEFTPTQPGTFEFSCGMGMIHGKITVAEPST